MYAKPTLPKPLFGSAKHVLIADDDADLVEMLSYVLIQQGYQVSTAADGWQVLQCVQEGLPDLILMDVMMPRLDGMETTRQLRQMPTLDQTPIVFLTARSEEYSQVAAFQSGADAFLTKPIKPRALVSRLQAFFNRLQERQDAPVGPVVLGNLSLDRSAYTLTKADRQIDLPRKEFELLYFLAAHSNQVFSRTQLLDHIWETRFVGARTVDVHVRKLREKIGEGYITTLKGIGYMAQAKEAG